MFFPSVTEEFYFCVCPHQVIYRALQIFNNVHYFLSTSFCSAQNYTKASVWLGQPSNTHCIDSSYSLKDQKNDQKRLIKSCNTTRLRTDVQGEHRMSRKF